MSAQPVPHLTEQLLERATQAAGALKGAANILRTDIGAPRTADALDACAEALLVEIAKAVAAHEVAT